MKDKKQLNNYKAREKIGNKRGHITYKERIKIEGFLEDEYTHQKIANNLKRGKSTISEEVKKGKCKDGIYRAEEAHRRSKMRQYYKKKDCLVVSMNNKLQKHVIKQTKGGVSPEDISEETGNKKNNLPYVSGKAIRKFIHKRRPDLEINLFWNRNNKKSGTKRKKGKYLGDIDRKFIEQRDTDFGWLFNLEYGHWEGDFIVSKHNSYVLLVLVEKLSRFTLIEVLPNRKNTLVNERISSMLKNYKVKSLTLDNDIAFQNWKELEKQLKCNIYFTHPYCSWEKGLVENMNRWIREFVPKKSDIKKFTKEKIQSVQDWMNSKPRKVLDGDTAFEVMMLEEKNVKISSILSDFPIAVCSY
jgi:IS30 family transposase